mgnify:FL=1
MRINVLSAYLDGKPRPKSDKVAYGSSTAAGRGFYSMAEMTTEYDREYMRDQKSSNNMMRVDGEMVGSWNLDF